MRRLKSKPSDPEESRKRVEAALRKQERGEPLTEKEMTIVYWIRHGGGCHACGGSGRHGVTVGVRPPIGRR